MSASFTPGGAREGLSTDTAHGLQRAGEQATNAAHVAATAAHGATGAVVGTTTTQTLTNKTLTAPAIADFTSAQHDHGDADDGGALAATALPAATASTQGAQSAAHFALTEQLAADSGWLGVSFGTNWSDFDATNQPCQFRRNALGQIELRGLAKKSSAISYTDTICTLLAGYRPAKQEIFASVGSAGAGDVLATIGVTSAGVVGLRSGGGATFVSLAGIVFRTD